MNAIRPALSLFDKLRARLRGRRKRRRAAREQLELRLTRIESLLNEQALRATVDAALERNPLLAFGRKVYSQNDEDGLISEIARRCGIAGDACFVELGVGDGTENNTLHLLLNGWRGAWFGGEPIVIDVPGDRLHFRRCWIDRDNVVQLVHEALHGMAISQPALLSLDLDGNDYHLTEALLNAGVRPSIWIAEYNPRFAPETRWVMPYDPQHQWQGTDYYGASLAAINDLLTRFEYRLVCCNANGVNAFFVAARHAAAFDDIDSSCAALFMPANYRGYPEAGHPRDLRVIRAALERVADEPRPR